MISNMSIVFCVITLLISLALPVAALVILAVRHRKQGLVTAWLVGALGFFVPQMLIRMPILNRIAGEEWFLTLSANYPMAFSFLLAFTAGLLELAGRYAGAKLLVKGTGYRRALAAGMGHGGIEAMVLIGMSYINNLIYISMINSGSFDAFLAQSAAMGADVAQLEAFRTTFLTTPPAMFLLAGVERLLTMICQCAMTVVVCYGVWAGKTWKGLLLCLGVHTLIDTTALLATPGGGNLLSQGAAYGIIYGMLTLVAALSVCILLRLRRRWGKEKEDVSEV